MTVLTDFTEVDHRRLGRDLDLFHVQEEAAGSVFWHERGYALFRAVEGYIRQQQKAHGYKEIKTPQLVQKGLWEASGHWENYRSNMFCTGDLLEDSDTLVEAELAIKPMNCPCHVQVFNANSVSYRQLPMRLAEFGTCHRNEPSGALHGILRLRQFTQDDAHIFCAEDQVESEAASFIHMLGAVYRDFGFTDITVGLSTRPEKRGGSEEMWDHAERALATATRAAGLAYEVYPGEGAFYGPKLEFALTDNKGRQWQCGTLQLDFLLPERLDASYTGQDGHRHRPVMLHRAILGSLERFIGILVEHHEGRLPAWLAPIQVAVVSVKPEPGIVRYAALVANRLEACGLRVLLDTEDDNLSARIKDITSQKIPFVLSVGGREQSSETVSMRRRGERSSETIALSALYRMLPTLCTMTAADGYGPEWEQVTSLPLTSMLEGWSLGDERTYGSMLNRARIVASNERARALA